MIKWETCPINTTLEHLTALGRRWCRHGPVVYVEVGRDLGNQHRKHECDNTYYLLVKALESRGLSLNEVINGDMDAL